MYSRLHIENYANRGRLKVFFTARKYRYQSHASKLCSSSPLGLSVTVLLTALPHFRSFPTGWAAHLISLVLILVSSIVSDTTSHLVKYHSLLLPCHNLQVHIPAMSCSSTQSPTLGPSSAFGSPEFPSPSSKQHRKAASTGGGRAWSQEEVSTEICHLRSII